MENNINFDIEVKWLKDLTDWLSSMDIVSAWTRAITKTAINIQDKAIEKTPVNRWILRNSWRFQINGLKWKVFNLQDYAVFVENDTSPHFPPISAIAPWAERKGLNAYAVAMWIAKSWTKWKYMLKTASENKEEELSSNFKFEIDKALEKLKQR